MISIHFPPSEYYVLPKTYLLFTDDKWCSILLAIIAGHALLQCFINEQRISGLKFGLSWNHSWPLSAAICAPAIFVFFCLCTVLLPSESEETGLTIFFSDWEVTFTSKKSKPMLAWRPAELCNLFKEDKLNHNQRWKVCYAYITHNSTIFPWLAAYKIADLLTVSHFFTKLHNVLLIKTCLWN